jgi:hypothetical protein
MKEPVELNDDVARALRMLGQAPPPEGMEARIAGRMRQRQVELAVAPARRRNILRWSFAAAAVVALVVLVEHHRAAGTNASVDRMAVVSPQHGTPLALPAIARTDVPVHVVRVVRLRRTARARIEPAKIPQNAPPLPMTEQEHLLLALARSPQLLPALADVTTSETVADHGLGKNAIFELDHQELTQLPPMPSGELK